jgi:hypothetical protein
MPTSHRAALSQAALPVRPAGLERPGDALENRERADRVIVGERPR